MTGLGSFLPGGGVDPAMVQAAIIGAQGIGHVVGDDYLDALPEAAFRPLAPGGANNLGGTAAWVRASLYLSEFMRHIDWTVEGGEADPLRWVLRARSGQKRPDIVTIERPDMAVFRGQLAYVRLYADQRAERTAEILTQMGMPFEFFGMIMGLQGSRNPKVFELMAITQVLAAHVAMIGKHHLACRRPDRLGAKVMPMLPTPGHAAFPSAHATEAFAVAGVLCALLDDPAVQPHYPSVAPLKELLAKQAERIAMNRVVAGVHYPVDTWAGAALGEAVSHLVVSLCRNGQIVPRSYVARDSDFLVNDFFENGAAFGLTRDSRPRAAVEVMASPLFGWLWSQAVSEFALA
jgi:membrane-associated phospholipid phosphatase